jgi:hypothetical protein
MLPLVFVVEDQPDYTAAACQLVRPPQLDGAERFGRIYTEELARLFSAI